MIDWRRFIQFLTQVPGELFYEWFLSVLFIFILWRPFTIWSLLLTGIPLNIGILININAARWNSLCDHSRIMVIAGHHFFIIFLTSNTLFRKGCLDDLAKYWLLLVFSSGCPQDLLVRHRFHGPMTIFQLVRIVSWLALVRAKSF